MANYYIFKAAKLAGSMTSGIKSRHNCFEYVLNLDLSQA